MMEEAKSQTVLDHIDQIVVPGNVFENPANEYYALCCWWEGMELLSQQASKADQEAMRHINPDGMFERVVCAGNIGPRNIRYTILNCIFQWYSVTACQYVRTVGAIAKKIGPNGSSPWKYVKRVIPDVLDFRDKVAAHLAFSKSDSRDGDADRILSSLPQIQFVRTRFVVGASRLTLSDGGNQSTAGFGCPWNVTEVHQELRKRCRPDLVSTERGHGL